MKIPKITVDSNYMKIKYRLNYIISFLMIFILLAVQSNVFTYSSDSELNSYSSTEEISVNSKYDETEELEFQAFEDPYSKIEELNQVVEVKKGSDFYIKISPRAESGDMLEIQPQPDPSTFLSPTIKSALDQAPNWVRDDLEVKFIELSQIRVDLGEDANLGFGDLDGDSDLDMICGSSLNELIYFENAGTNYEPMFKKSDLGITDLIQDIDLINADPVMGDVNNDDTIDIVIGNENGDIIVLFNTGDEYNPHFNISYNNVAFLSSYSSPTLGDLDFDGDLDLISGAGDGKIYYYENMGDSDYNFPWSSFQPNVGIIDVGSRSKPSLSDLDGDGDLDLTIGEEQAILNYYENVGSTNNPVWRLDNTMYLGIILPPQTSPVIVDLNGDMRLDLVVGCSNGGLFKFTNIGTSTNAQWQIWSSYKIWPGVEYYDPQEYVRCLDFKLSEEYANLIIDSSVNLKDEIAFSVAHTSVQALGHSSTDPSLYKKNAELLYEIDQFLDYADIKDHGDYQTRNYFSTVEYKYKSVNTSSILTTELPKEIYYWYVVHPKITDETPAYINPSTGEPAQAPLGRFWREYLFYHNDTEYPDDPPTDPDENGIPNFHYPKEESPPLLKDKLSGIKYLYDNQPYNSPMGYNNQGYNNTRPWGYKDHAIEAVSNWVAKTLPLNEQESADGERPVQPVRIAHHHNGNCGELQDLTIAAARTALIPAVGIQLFAEDHVWSEFYDHGWHQWDNYWSDGGSVVDNFMNYWVGWNQRGGSGIGKWHGDDSITDVTESYVYDHDLSTIKIKVVDRNGNPVDGARVMVGSHWLTGQASGYQVTIPYPSIWNYTDNNGSCTFRVATQEGLPDGNKNFSFKVTSKIGNAEQIKTELEHGQDYSFRFTLDGVVPEPIIYGSLNTPDPSEYLDRYYASLYFEFIDAHQQPPNPLVGNYHPQNITGVNSMYFLICNETNFIKYCSENSPGADQEFIIAWEARELDGYSLAIDLPSLDDWYLVWFNKHSIETYKSMAIRLSLYEKPDHKPELGIIAPKDNQAFKVGETITISGYARDDRNIRRLTLTIEKERYDITNLIKDGNWSYGWSTKNLKPGRYNITVEVEDSAENIVQQKLTIILESLPPPDFTPPVIKIDEPKNGSTFLVGTPVKLSGLASDDSELSLTSLTMTIDSRSINLLKDLYDDHWVYTWDSAGKREGKYEFKIKGIDQNSNIGYAHGYFELIKEEKDVDPPVITIDSPKLADSYSLGSNIIIKGTVTDDSEISSLRINIDYSGWLDITDNLIGKTYTYSWYTSVLAGTVGEHIIAVQATDEAENSDEATTIIQLVDETAPTIEVQKPYNGESFSAGDTLSIGGIVEDNVGIDELAITIIGEGRNIEITKGIEFSETSWQYKWSIPKFFTSGSYTITVKAIDRFGNTDIDSVTIAITGQKKTDKEVGLLGLPGFEAVILVFVVFTLIIVSKKRK